MAIRLHTVQRNSTLTKHLRGFTLLELLVVVVILGLLASYIGPRYFAQVGKAESGVARSQIDAFEKAIDQYQLDVGHPPTTEQGLNALFQKPGNETRWKGPYLKKTPPNDPWGRPYQYSSPGKDGAEYSIGSFGRDGAPGGDGPDADIFN
jgi:general secretion pathway protein G